MRVFVCVRVVCVCVSRVPVWMCGNADGAMIMYHLSIGGVKSAICGRILYCQLDLILKCTR